MNGRKWGDWRGRWPLREPRSTFCKRNIFVASIHSQLMGDDHPQLWWLVVITFFCKWDQRCAREIFCRYTVYIVYTPTRIDNVFSDNVVPGDHFPFLICMVCVSDCKWSPLSWAALLSVRVWDPFSTLQKCFLRSVAVYCIFSIVLYVHDCV